MKNILKTFLAGLLLIVAYGCEDSTLAIDELYENVDTSGAFIRSLVPPSTGPHNITVGDNFPDAIEAEIEVQEGNGSVQPDFVEVRIYISLYEDQNQETDVLDSNGNPFAEVLFETIPASDFVPSDVNNLPSTNFSIPTQTIVDTFTDAQYTLPTYAYTRLELEMTDGRIFTDTSVGPTVATGNYFLAPFFYNIIFLNL